MIYRIINNTVVETVSLPYLHANHACQTVERVCEVTGEDWREGLDPDYDPRSELLGDYIVGATVTCAVLPRPVAEVEAECLAAIDVAAGEARRRLVSPGELVLEEYRLAAIDARAYRDAGYAGPVPAGVSSWATPKGWTAQQAADDIIATEALWVGASNAIRAIRLASKEQVRLAGSPAEKVAAMEAGVAQLDSIAR